MSLQYRMRDMSADRRWQQCVTLSERLIIETLDLWCRTDQDFPTSQLVAAVLYLFSPRCEPLALSIQNVRKTVFEQVGSADDEYRHSWPNRTPQQCVDMIRAMESTLENAVRQWSEGSILTPTTESVNQQLVELIIAHQYVVFYHHQTTRRDFGGFYSHG